MDEIKNHGKKWIYWLTMGIILIVVYKILDQLPNVTEGIGNFFNAMQPIVLGVLIAYLLYLPCKKFENLYKKCKLKIIKNKARSFSIFTVYILAVIIISFIITSIGPIIVDSTKGLIGNLQGYIQSSVQKYQELPEDSFLKGQTISLIIDKISDIDFKEYVNLDSITQYAKGAIGVFTGIFNVFVAFIVSIYVLSERDRIENFLKRLAKAILSNNRYKGLSKYFHSANNIFLKFLTGQILDAIVVSILTAIAMGLMGVKYAVLLGFLIGIFNIVPYFGAIIGIIIASIITLITGGLSQAIWMIIVVIILQQIDANIINPKIIGNSLKISPLLVIISVIIGGLYWGMWGILLSVPACALIKILTEDYIDYKLLMKKNKEVKE